MTGWSAATCGHLITAPGLHETYDLYPREYTYRSPVRDYNEFKGYEQDVLKMPRPLGSAFLAGGLVMLAGAGVTLDPVAGGLSIPFFVLSAIFYGKGV